MTRTGELPFSPYYGSIDATPLWLVLLGETHDWTGDDALVDRLWPNVLAALAWIDDWGDRDGDGFVEYERRASTGLLNQGWKDSGDAIRWADGTLAATPIALAEVQGYVFDAKRRIARLARRRGENELADRLESEALDLKRRFAEQFILPNGYIAMALDATKRPSTRSARTPVTACGAASCDDAHAATVAEVLGSPAMSSGWGVRTFASDQPGFNPIGYHTGTVWPHDTAIAAAGARRYGFDAIGGKLSGGLLAAAHHFPAYRLPELFCGFDRESTAAPVAYPVACSPQAWAAGSPLMLIRTMLGPARRRLARPADPREAGPAQGHHQGRRDRPAGRRRHVRPVAPSLARPDQRRGAAQGRPARGDRPTVSGDRPAADRRCGSPRSLRRWRPSRPSRTAAPSGSWPSSSTSCIGAATR